MDPAVFLDRDGTLAWEAGYVDRPERLVLFPYVVDALRLLRRAGFRLVVITNQAGLAHGMFDEAALDAIHDDLTRRLRTGGVELDGIYVCPHHTDASIERYRVACDCRKPRPGLVRQAERELGLDLARSFVVGDRWRDVGVAQSCGARGILVRTGYGETEAAHPPPGAAVAAVVDNLMQATTWILMNRA